MSFNARTVAPALLLLVFAGMLATSVLAGASAEGLANHCPARTVCDHALGVALTPPTNWRLLPAGKLPPHTIVLHALPVTGLSYNVRLVIASDGTTRDRNDLRAATQAARAFTRGYTHMRPPLVRVPVRYGGAPGIMIRNLPGQPTAVTITILAHRGALYRISVPGATPARDQLTALRSLRFIPRVGPFPPANPAAPRGHGLRLSPVEVKASRVANHEFVRSIVRVIVRMGVRYRNI
jgi:hypothetical protein